MGMYSMNNNLNLEILNHIEQDVKKFSHVVSKNLVKTLTEALVKE